MSKRRYTCPQCSGGILAPERMRKNDVRRYCLACSAKTGRLVERTCPALERKRDARRLRTAEKSRERRAREKEARTVLGVDLDAMGRRLLRAGIKSLGTDPRRPYVDRDVPREIKIRRSKRTHRDGTNGYAYGSAWNMGGRGGRITITIYPATTPAHFVACLTHEFAHLFTKHPRSESGRGDYHGRAFRRVQAEIVKHAFGIEIGGAGTAWENYNELRLALEPLFPKGE